MTRHLTRVLLPFVWLCCLLVWLGGCAPAAGAVTSDAAADSLCIVMLPLGDADCFFVRQGDACMLVDAGLSTSSDEILSFLRQQNVQKLDYVIATHPHADHIGGMSAVLSNYDVGLFLAPSLPDELVPTTKTYLTLLNTLNAQHTNTAVAKPGAQYTLGTATIDILGPVQDFSDLNDQSIVFRLTFGNRHALFMGDAEERACDALLSSGSALSADILKVAHHGSNDSSKTRFLKAVSPTYALISCGSTDDSHPSDKVLERLYEQHTTCYRANLCGRVTLTIQHDEITIDTEKAAA